MAESNMSCFAIGQKNRGVKKIADPAPISHSYKFTGRTFFRCLPTKMITHTHTHTHTHFQVQGLEKGVSENEAPGPIGAYTTTHNDTITLMPNLIQRISFTELKFECRARGLPRVYRPAAPP